MRGITLIKFSEPERLMVLDMFKHNKINNIEFLTITEFDKSGLVRHGFSTRKGGVSLGEAGTMNFGFNRKDTRENIVKNFELFCTVLGVDYKKIVFTNQTHEDVVYAVTKKDIGKGLMTISDIKGVDALVTNIPNIPLCTFHADCMPLFFLDTNKKAIGLTHSGWKSTLLNIAQKTVQKMQSEYGCNPADIIVAIGPSIGVCHFEVGQGVADKFKEKFGDEYIINGETPHIDLWQLCKSQLINAGILSHNITITDICTFCNNDLFYSYRGDNHKTGSMVSIMELRGEDDE